MYVARDCEREKERGKLKPHIAEPTRGRKLTEKGEVVLHIDLAVK